jgi:hypothetical protein
MTVKWMGHVGIVVDAMAKRIAFENYADQYLLCNVRRPGGMLVELAQKLGGQRR